MLPTSFQFHKGTIRTEEDSIYDMRLANFNSIKVRLEQRTDFVYYAECEFQFHKGTIRTHTSLVIALQFIYFNSIKVRLERVSMLFVS